MKNRPVLFLDSGLGGLPYCRDFIKRNPKERVCYLADRKNFPYGPRTNEEITGILTLLAEKLIKILNPKIAVLACNTASISSLASLRLHFPRLPFVGTVPAIKPAAIACKCGTVGILGTDRTIAGIRTLNLEEGRCKIFGVAAPELVEFVEQNFYKTNEEEKKEIVKKYVSMFKEAETDTLVLGCTHFLYLLEIFRTEAAPFIKIFDSLDGITKRIEFLLNENNSALRAQNYSENSNLLILTGTQKPDITWQNIAGELKLKLCLLDEL